MSCAVRSLDIEDTVRIEGISYSLSVAHYHTFSSLFSLIFPCAAGRVLSWAQSQVPEILYAILLVGGAPILVLIARHDILSFYQKVHIHCIPFFLLFYQ